MKKALVFDFDGVILDSNHIKDETFLILYKKYGKKFSNYVLNHHKNNRGISRFEKFKIYHKILFGNNIKKKEIEKLNQSMNSIIINRMIKTKFIYGVKNFLKNYHKIYDCFIISASPEGELKEICDKKKISNYFIKIYGSPDNKFKNLNKLIKTYKYKRKEILYLGDSNNDYFFAKKSKISFINVRNKSLSLITKEYTFINSFLNFNIILQNHND